MSRSFLAAALISLLAGACEAPASSESATETDAPAVESADALVQENVPYTDPAAGVTFNHLVDYTTGPCDSETPDCIGVFAEPAGEPLVRIEVHDGDLATVGREQAGFEPNADGVLMTTYGRFEPVPVTAFEGQGWDGQRATITCGVSDAETGFHAAGGECLWAVASSGSRSVLLVSDGSQAGFDAAEFALSSLHILAR